MRAVDGTSLRRSREVLRRRDPHRNIDTSQSPRPRTSRLDPLGGDNINAPPNGTGAVGIPILPCSRNSSGVAFTGNQPMLRITPEYARSHGPFGRRQGTFCAHRLDDRRQRHADTCVRLPESGDDGIWIRVYNGQGCALSREFEPFIRNMVWAGIGADTMK
jgi:hypothetical protein